MAAITASSVKAIVVDIEGTTTSISFVHDTLFPYAKAHVQDYVSKHGHKDQVKNILKAVQEKANVSSDQVVSTLIQWMNEDKKETSLKELQGLMWEEGYRTKAFFGHVYEDAYRELNNWKNQGLSLYVYSSGSVQAQRLLFGCSDYQDMTPLFSGHFDTQIGGKKEAASYAKIAQQVNIAAGEILFLSDTTAELEAARQAGMKTILIDREGLAPKESGFFCVKNFHEIVLP